MEGTPVGVPTPPPPKEIALPKTAKRKYVKKADKEAKKAAEFDDLREMFSELVQLTKDTQGAHAREMQSLKAELAVLKQTPHAMALEELKSDIRTDVIHVRVKPYNHRRGHLRIRQYVRELKQVLSGGTGKLGDVPEWYEVDPGLAPAFDNYRQDPYDPGSPCVFDVCTAEQRMRVDKMEEAMRLGQAGIGAPPDVITKGVKAQTRSTSPLEPDTPANIPSVAEGAESFADHVGVALPAAMEGRAAALEGMEPTGQTGATTGGVRRQQKQKQAPAEKGQEVQDITAEVDDYPGLDDLVSRASKAKDHITAKMARK